MTYLVSFHGGTGKDDRNNIHNYENDGSKAEPSKILNKDSLPDDIELRELRSFIFGPDGNLYVANSYKKYSQILCFDSAPNKDGQYNFKSVFTHFQEKYNWGLLHPFQIIFGPDGNAYVSSQDENCVLRYYGPNAKDGVPGTPMPFPSALHDYSQGCAPGTFIPATSFETNTKSLSSVRGIIFGSDGNFYVSDIEAHKVYVFNSETGAYIKTILSKKIYPDLNRPNHLLLKNNKLIIGNSGNDTVIITDPSASSIIVDVFVDKIPKKLNGPSGMLFTTINGEKYFLLGSRNTKSILQFTYKKNQTTFIKNFKENIKDNPEFIIES